MFEEVEKPALLPLPPARFELFNEALRHVNRDGHVQIKGAYYSAPPEFLGQDLWARWDGRTVRLFDKKMAQIALHVQQEPGRFATAAIHIRPEKISDIEKGTTWLLERAGRFGPNASAWSAAMLRSRGIEGVRVLMGLLSLGNKHPWRAVDEACRIANGHGTYRLRCVRKLIERQPGDQQIQSMMPFITEHAIIRPVDDYGQWVREALANKTQHTCHIRTGVHHMRSSLEQSLKTLRLSGLAASLDIRLTEARGNHLEHEEFLELALADELAVRSSRLVERRVRAAMFREIKSLDEFDFSFNPSIKRKQVSDLATCKFVRDKADVLFLGPPGVGKSFLAQAIGHAAIKCGFVVLYRSVFDLARDFMNEETLGDESNKMLTRYLKPDLLIIDDMGMKQLPRR